MGNRTSLIAAEDLLLLATAKNEEHIATIADSLIVYSTQCGFLVNICQASVVFVIFISTTTCFFQANLSLKVK